VNGARTAAVILSFVTRRLILCDAVPIRITSAGAGLSGSSRPDRFASISAAANSELNRAIATA
jgi:hypothetical protein